MQQLQACFCSAIPRQVTPYTAGCVVVLLFCLKAPTAYCQAGHSFTFKQAQLALEQSSLAPCPPEANLCEVNAMLSSLAHLLKHLLAY
jgi:hypothetical protein